MTSFSFAHPGMRALAMATRNRYRSFIILNTDSMQMLAAFQLHRKGFRGADNALPMSKSSVQAAAQNDYCRDNHQFPHRKRIAWLKLAQQATGEHDCQPNYHQRRGVIHNSHLAASLFCHKSEERNGGQPNTPNGRVTKLRPMIKVWMVLVQCHDRVRALVAKCSQ